jgi:hypothetical protein
VRHSSGIRQRVGFLSQPAPWSQTRNAAEASKQTIEHAETAEEPRPSLRAPACIALSAIGRNRRSRVARRASRRFKPLTSCCSPSGTNSVSTRTPRCSRRSPTRSHRRLAGARRWPKSECGRQRRLAPVPDGSHLRSVRPVHPRSSRSSDGVSPGSGAVDVAVDVPGPVAPSFTRCPGAPYYGHLVRGRLRPPCGLPGRSHRHE